MRRRYSWKDTLATQVDLLDRFRALQKRAFKGKSAKFTHTACVSWTAKEKDIKDIDKFLPDGNGHLTWYVARR